MQVCSIYAWRISWNVYSAAEISEVREVTEIPLLSTEKKKEKNVYHDGLGSTLPQDGPSLLKRPPGQKVWVHLI